MAGRQTTRLRQVKRYKLILLTRPSLDCHAQLKARQLYHTLAIRFIRRRHHNTRYSSNIPVHKTLLMDMVQSVSNLKSHGTLVALGPLASTAEEDDERRERVLEKDAPTGREHRA
jgi:hypothetical protein